MTYNTRSNKTELADDFGKHALELAKKINNVDRRSRAVGATKFFKYIRMNVHVLERSGKLLDYSALKKHK